MADEPLDDIEDREEEDNSLDMSDEDFLKAEPPAPLEEEKEAVTEGEEVLDADPEEPTDASETDLTDKDNSTTVDTDSTDTEGAVEEEETDPEPEKDVANTETEEPEKDVPSLDYEVEYGKVMAPFTANGVEMKPKNAEDVVRLMQMGANYHKKMAGMKPSMKVLKLLKNNDLLDQDKLNYLIDLNNKNPAAITKLLKDSGIDPLEVNTKEESNYKPTPRSVSDTEIDLDSVLDTIKDTPSYDKTLNILTKVWDEKSRSIIANTPNIISVINGHVADGTYNKVMGAVEYARSMGDLAGVSDLDAYKAMGDKLQSEGEFDPEPNADIPAKVKPVKPKTSPVTEAKRQSKKRAAAPVKSKGKAAASNFDPLSMSDEDFAKFDESSLPTV